MLNKPIRNTQDFLLSNYFVEGLRITFGVICPPLILAHFGMLQYGITLSLGAICVSIVDTPGPMHHRRNAMLVTIALLFIVSIIVGLTNKNIIFTGVILVIFSFIFSMFLLFGNRASAIGVAVLLVMVLSIDDIRPWNEVLLSAGLVLCGGVWYAILSYTIYRIRPYRLAQQVLSDSILQVAEFLRAKAKFYEEKVNYDKNFKSLVELQVEVSQKQDEVREVLFRTREIVKESTPQGRFLLVVFTDMVDLFEQVMSTYYNYEQLHNQFDKAGILYRYKLIINKISYALDDIAFALKTGGTPIISNTLDQDLLNLKSEIEKLEQTESSEYNALGIIALKNIEVNIENIVQRVKNIVSYFNKKERSKIKNGDIDVAKFVNKQQIDIKILVDNLNFKSAVFRHSLRVSIVMLVGYIAAKSLDFSHSYWILLTILVISKPGFSLTKERNYHRIIGTVIGAFIGMGILHFVNDKNTLFFILIVFMIGAYSFQRKNYVISVLFMTPYILIMFDFLGLGTMAVARERIYDTLIGSGIAFTASYLLFPNWEKEKLKEAMVNTLKSNAEYFKQVIRLYFEDENDITSYKLARKDIFINSSNLSSLFQRMFSEPKSKQIYIKELHQFTVLNHLLTSYVASLALYIKEHNFISVNRDSLKLIAEHTTFLLNSSVDNLFYDKEGINNVQLIHRKNEEENVLHADIQENNTAIIEEHFDLIQKVAYDIYKITEKINVKNF